MSKEKTYIKFEFIDGEIKCTQSGSLSYLTNMDKNKIVDILKREIKDYIKVFNMKPAAKKHVSSQPTQL